MRGFPVLACLLACLTTMHVLVTVVVGLLHRHWVGMFGLRRDSTSELVAALDPGRLSSSQHRPGYGNGSRIIGDKCAAQMISVLAKHQDLRGGSTA